MKKQLTLFSLFYLCVFFSIAQESNNLAKINEHLNIQVSYIKNREIIEGKYMDRLYKAEAERNINNSTYSNFFEKRTALEDNFIKLYSTETLPTFSNSSNTNEHKTEKKASVKYDDVKSKSTKKRHEDNIVSSPDKVKTVEENSPGITDMSNIEEIVFKEASKEPPITQETAVKKTSKNLNIKITNQEDIQIEISENDKLLEEQITEDVIHPADQELLAASKLLEEQITEDVIHPADQELLAASKLFEDTRSKLLNLYDTKFKETTFLVQIASLKRNTSVMSVARDFGINESLVMIRIGGLYKYFIEPFESYSTAKEKVIQLSEGGINSFIVVKNGKDYVLPNLFFKSKIGN